MEMGLAVAAFIISVLSLACTASAVVLLLMMATPKEEGAEMPPEQLTKTVTDDVEKRRRQAVRAAEHRNFMDYDGTPQAPIDPATILADGG